MKNKTCIVVAGPTAVGKTSYGIELALKHNTPIISADSRQCFKELNIGVAKPSDEQLKKVTHYFINSHSITDEVNARVFEEYAIGKVHQIFEEHDVAVMVGGTGLYIKAFAEGLNEIPAVDLSIRKQINEFYQTRGYQWLREELEKTDPVFFAKGEMQNPQRMLRALEVKLSTGRSVLEFHTKQKTKRNFDIDIRFLELPRQQLYQLINERVDRMMESGLLNEARNLYRYKSLNALQTVGYKELFDYFDGKISYESAVEEIKKNTRHYAKRQMTWFKKYL